MAEKSRTCPNCGASLPKGVDTCEYCATVTVGEDNPPGVGAVAPLSAAGRSALAEIMRSLDSEPWLLPREVDTIIAALRSVEEEADSGNKRLLRRIRAKLVHYRSICLEPGMERIDLQLEIIEALEDLLEGKLRLESLAEAP